MEIGGFVSAFLQASSERMTCVTYFGVFTPSPLNQGTNPGPWGIHAHKGCWRHAREPFLEWEIDEPGDDGRTN